MKNNQALTMFTFGYWGWGTSTKQLIQAVDAVEKERGYDPPLFVDIRIRRAVRAPGFSGDAFQKTVGESRYRWKQDLGNLGILEGGGIKIKDPRAAEDLLDLAILAGEDKRRVIFFCACGMPFNCHRSTVAGLILAAASRRKIPVQIVEWPGGEPDPKGPEVVVSDVVYKSLLNGRLSIPLSNKYSISEMAGLPWGSVVTIRQANSGTAEPLKAWVGYAHFIKGEWVLPLMCGVNPSVSMKTLQRNIKSWRKAYGFEARIK